MSRSYPIWNQVQACHYNSGKSYGNKETGNVTVYVGSSSSNSTELIEHTVTKREGTYKGKDVIIFRFYADDVCLRIKIFENNRGRAGDLIKTIDKLKSIKGLSMSKYN